MTASTHRGAAGLGSVETQLAPSMEPSGLWGRAFRPFFLGAALQAALGIPVWTALWLGALPAPRWLAPVWWHGHEMLFGFVAAAIAGFLLTASPVWTGRRALSGRPLGGLFALWVAGRLALAGATRLPLWLVAVVDAAFLPAVALVVARTLWGSGQPRNYGVVGVVLALALANAAMHASALGLVADTAPTALRFGVDAVVVLILVIGGRITPAFTANAFRRDGIAEPVRAWPWLNAVVVGAGGALALVSLAAARTPASGLCAMLAGVAGLVRLAGWQPWQTRADPLLWSLHLGTAWVAVGLVLVGLGDLGAPVPASAGLHALTAGGMGATILAVMTRVGLGHTGRPLELPRGVVWAYALVSAGALARVAASFASGGAQRVLLVAGGLAWAAAFGIFVVRYGGVLVRPRIDGRPG